MERAEVWNQFDTMARSPEEEIDLARAAYLIAATEYPDLNIEYELHRLNSLAGDAGQRLDDDDPLYVVNTLSEHLFDELGFKGNHRSYNDPRNSFLNDVIERKLGIPITLSLLYIEIGRRLSIPLQGIGMPGHFLVKHRDVDDFYVDPFHSGILLSIDECAQRMTQATQGTVKWHPRYLEPIGSREFLARMLRNLKVNYLQKRDYHRVLNTIDRLLALQPQSSQELRDRGVVNYRLGNYTEALDDLRIYVGSSTSVQDTATVNKLIEQIQGILND